MTSADNSQRNTAVVWATIAFGGALYFMWPTALSILHIWNTSDTFTHGFLVLPVFAYLVWHKRESLALCTPKTEWRILPLIAIVSALWLLAQQAGIQVIEHTALVVILILTIWAVVGNDIAKTISFPLAFLIFLAPMGDELVPSLMELTADITVWAITVSGIPVYREGLFFSLPSGNWSVVEACSGVRYLIASIVLGSVYAYLSYRSYKRRLLFMIISILVPIIANSLRAYLIVMLGHLSGNELATGVDHLVYGWLFFGIVMFAMFALGSTFSETESIDLQSPISTDHTTRTPSVGNHASFTGFLVVLLLVIAAAPVWSSTIHKNRSQISQNLTSTQINKILPGTEMHPEKYNDKDDWNPIIQGYMQKTVKTYQTTSQAKVRAMAFIYKDQKQGHEMISSINRLTKGTADSQWRTTSSNQFPLTNIDMHSRAKIDDLEIRTSNTGLVVWRWYSINGRITNNPIKAKFMELRNQLTLKPNVSVHYILATDKDNEKANDALSEVIKLIIEPNI